MPARNRIYNAEWYRIAIKVYAEEDACWLCGLPVDQTLPKNHPMSRSADHLWSAKHGGPNTRENARLAHRGCNSARGVALQRLPRAECACRWGRPCGRVQDPSAPRGYVSLDVSEL